MTSTKRFLEAAIADFLVHHRGDDPLRLELRQLGKDARRGSRGEAHCSGDEALFDEARDVNYLAAWFLDHKSWE